MSLILSCKLFFNVRILINPEYVENLDSSDGAFQFDAEDQERFNEVMT